MTSYPGGSSSPTSSAESVPWRKARSSSAGPAQACVQATPATLRPDGSVVVDLGDQPPVVLLRASAERSARPE
jgi:hypothetical protein